MVRNTGDPTGGVGEGVRVARHVETCVEHVPQRQANRVGRDRPSVAAGAHSVAGKDPVFSTDEPAPLSPGVLPSTTTVGAGLVAPNGATVDVAGHEVAYDPDSSRWYTDVTIDDPQTSMPFVRLVLCRFQPHSVDGAHLSPLIVTDPLRLGPTRTSTVRLADAGATISVSVVGRSHHGVQNPDDPDDWVYDQVVAWIEERDTSIVDRDLGWTTVEGPVELSRRRVDRLDVWTYGFAAPDGGFSDDAEIRVRLEEREPLLVGPADGASIRYKPVFVETLRMPRQAFAARQHVVARR